MLSRILSTLNSISLSGYGNVATSLTSKTSYQDHFARTAGVSSAFSLASRLDSPRTAQQRDGGTQPGHVASPRCRSSRPERDVHLRAVVQPIALWATIPAWLYMGLWISYGLIFVGQIRACWIPSFSLGNRTCPMLSDDVQQMFSNTHHFLPIRKGLSRTPRTSCSIWQPQPRCSFFSRAEDG